MKAGLVGSEVGKIDSTTAIDIVTGASGTR